jgi:hypothetical protein
MTTKEKTNSGGKGLMRMQWTSVLLALVLVALVIGACTAGPSELRNVPDADGDVAGFWKGLWHGFISPFTFIWAHRPSSEAAAGAPPAGAGAGGTRTTHGWRVVSIHVHQE